MISIAPNNRVSKIANTSSINKVSEEFQLCSEGEGTYNIQLSPDWIIRNGEKEACYVHLVATNEQNTPSDYKYAIVFKRLDSMGRFIENLGIEYSSEGSLAHSIVWVMIRRGEKIGLSITTQGQTKYRKGLLTRYAPKLRIYFGRGQERDGHTAELGK